jgi:hypothetical protein
MNINLRESDDLIAWLAPDALLAVDASACIVLATPERRVTIGDAQEWAGHILAARVQAQIRHECVELRAGCPFCSGQRGSAYPDCICLNDCSAPSCAASELRLA